ncbi:Transmembrane domain-containing protein [Spironucleus salmonicida]|uniref:Transmembrane domain-containing protein n=2 Tax=Spironucleus salmonicida TaxID=348837 RepID=A0A9P8LWF7_9EUKA|nr:Transmembrane domain-containing protein [Spironucleus salmonicida]
MTSVASSSMRSCASKLNFQEMITGPIHSYIIKNIIVNVVISLISPFQFIMNALIISVNVGRSSLYIYAFCIPFYEIFVNLMTTAISQHAIKDVQMHIVNQRFKAANIYLSYAFFQSFILSVITTLVFLLTFQLIMARFLEDISQVRLVIVPQLIGGFLGTGVLPILKKLIFLDKNGPLIYGSISFLSVAIQLLIFQISIFYSPKSMFLILGISFLIQNLLVLIFGLFRFMSFSNSTMDTSNLYRISFRSIQPIKMAIFIKISIYSFAQVCSNAILNVSIILAYYTGISYVGSESYYAEINIFMANFYMFYNQFCRQFSMYQLEQIQDILVTNKEMGKLGRVKTIITQLSAISFLFNLLINFVLYFTTPLIVNFVFSLYVSKIDGESLYYKNFVESSIHGLWVSNVIGVISPFTALGELLIEFMQDRRLFEIQFISGWFAIVSQFILFSFSSFKVNSYSVIFVVQMTQSAASIASFIILQKQLNRDFDMKDIQQDEGSAEVDEHMQQQADDENYPIFQLGNFPMTQKLSHKGSLIDVLTTSRNSQNMSSSQILNDNSMTINSINISTQLQPLETARFQNVNMPQKNDSTLNVSQTFDFGKFQE